LFKQSTRFRHAELHLNAPACRKADGSTVIGAHFNYFAQNLCELIGPARWNYATNTSNDSACVSSVGDHARECHGHRLAENKGKCFVDRTQAEHVHRGIKTLHLPPLSKQHAPAFQLSLSHQPHQKIVPVIDSPTNEHESDQGISPRDDCSSPQEALVVLRWIESCDNPDDDEFRLDSELPTGCVSQSYDFPQVRKLKSVWNNPHARGLVSPTDVRYTRGLGATYYYTRKPWRQNRTQPHHENRQPWLTANESSVVKTPNYRPKPGSARG
jgi:hypothetical protein